jgi:NTE family protein
MRGLAHIGVLRAFEEAGLKIDYIAGCSMGSIVGSAYACGIPTNELAETATQMAKMSMYFDLGLIGGRGLIKGTKAEAIIRKLTEDKEFKDTKIPLSVIACDIENGELVTFTEGKIYRAVRASISVPLLFEPAIIDDKLLVDGAMMARVPSQTCRDMGADVVVGVDVGYRGGKRERAKNAIEVMLQSWDVMQWKGQRAQDPLADIMLAPDVQHIDLLKTDSPNECIELGYQTAKQAMPSIRIAMEKAQMQKTFLGRIKMYLAKKR